MFDSFKEDIKSFMEHDPAARSPIEIVLLYPGFKALQSHKRAKWFLNHNMPFIARYISQRSAHKTGIEIHPGATIGRRVCIDHGNGIVIGETTEIGDDVMIYQGVTLGGTGKDVGKRHPTIESGVMIGSGAKVLGPITVGRNAKVAAGAVVVKDVEPNCTGVGVPGEVVRIDGERVDDLDQINIPDPLMNLIRENQAEIEKLKEEIEKLKVAMSRVQMVCKSPSHPAGMKIYNTMTRKKEEFVPNDPKEVKIYACGPTVYNYIHIGNARPLCVFDVLRRYLEYRGYNVKFVQNFTDVDDKIIKRANEEGSTFEEISKKYIEEFWTDANGLNFKKATVHPKATENIDEIINIIKTLEEKGYAYSVDGDVYFRTLKFKDYGKLSHQPIEDLQSGARIAIGEKKENPLDFALWKAAKEGEPYWQSPWGKGRPGWHIECSAMNKRYLGDTIDIHCGGQDLIFPHHENEIAQSECANGCTFSKYWMHNGYINVDNVKMSKSLGNFKTVREIANVYGYEVIRYFLVSSHYRSPINYSLEIIEQCKSALERLYTCRESLDFAIKNAKDIADDTELIDRINSRREQFIKAMDDDLNTADGVAAIFDLVKDINISILDKEVSKNVCQTAADVFDELCDVLGILYNRKSNDVDADIEALIEERQTARANKDWATADRIRDELKAKGIILKDTPQGVTWTKE